MADIIDLFDFLLPDVGTGSQSGTESGTVTKVKTGLADTANLKFDDFTADRDICLLYTSPSPRDRQKSRMPSSA